MNSIFNVTFKLKDKNLQDEHAFINLYDMWTIIPTKYKLNM